MDDYGPQWRRYQRHNRLGILAVALLLGSAPLAMLMDRLGFSPDAAQLVFLTSAAVGSLSLLVLGYMISQWRCPRCHQRYSAGRHLDSMSDGRRCVHCGLGLYESEGGG